MTLRKPLFASLAILALAMPVTGGVIVTFSASPAMAKGKDKGGSDRGSRSDRGDRGKSDRGRGSQGGNSRGGSGNGHGFGSSNGGGNGNGQGNGQGHGQSANVKPAKAVTTVEPEATDGELDLRPNQLGSMNGAMHANINAVLAHIRNGNTNGPVGALAGLAVADHDAAEAQEVIETAGAFETLDEALEAAGYENLQDYLDSGETDGDVDAALTALGDLTEEDRPSADEIADAQDAVDALPEAEAAIFDAWNKSGEATEEEKAALLDALRERLESDSALIDAALAETEGDGAEDEGAGDDGGEASADGTEDEGGESDGEEEGDGEPGEEDTASLDPETKAMIDGLKF